MKLRRTLGPSLRALLAHKMRAVLALASIAVGVAAVALSSAIGKGARLEVIRGIESMGTNLLIVKPLQVKRQTARKAIRGFATSLEMEDYEAIAGLPLVAEAAPGAEGAVRVKAGGNSGNAMVTAILGTTPAFPSVRRFRLRSGRFFDAADDGARVAVLGARVADTLFPGEDPVGQVIRVRGVPFDVLGVLEAKGGSADAGDEDNQILIPIRTALRRVFNAAWLGTVYVSVRKPEQMDRAQIEIERLLRERHGGASDDFAVQNTAKSRSMQSQMAESLTLLTTGLAGLALLVGGTGILGLMLLSVKERTGEIGLRMAVGARPADVFLQFLLEALLLAAGGWVAGAAAGSLGAVLVAVGTSWTIGVPFEALLASLAMTMAIGLGFGAFPARRAALLTPVQALAVE